MIGDGLVKGFSWKKNGMLGQMDVTTAPREHEIWNSEGKEYTEPGSEHVPIDCGPVLNVYVYSFYHVPAIIEIFQCGMMGDKYIINE